MSSTAKSKTSSPRLPIVLFSIVLVGVAGALIYWHHNTPLPHAQLREVQRHELQMRDGRWYEPGNTNGFTGLLIDTYADGGRRSRSAVSNGLLEGLSTGWYTNGQVQIEEHFHAGVSHGHRIKWYPDGQKQSEADIIAGKIEGIFRRWHENGALAEEIQMSNGLPNGLSHAWTPEGQLKAEIMASNGIPIAAQPSSRAQP